MSDSEPRRARVLVVDDSAFMRRLVSDVIAESGEFDVVGTARDGMHALTQVLELQPDIVTLDIDMPGQDGLAVLREIMARDPRPVIMLSAGGADGGVEATLRALELGAVEFVRKPSGAISLDLDAVREQLLDALRAAACSNRETLRRPQARASATNGTAPSTSSSASARASARASASVTGVVHAATSAPPEIRHAERNADDAQPTSATTLVCIAASTGGPAALARVIPKIPRLRDTAICIAQHMPPGFTASLARRLDASSRMTVREATDGEPLRAGHVYIAPGGQHLRIGLRAGVTVLQLDSDAPLWGVRPAADHLFHSGAAVFGRRCIGVVMTGMGCDGADGLFAVRHAGGLGLVQDEPTSVIPGMPRAALLHAGAERVAPLEEIAAAITELVALRAPVAAAAARPVLSPERPTRVRGVS